MAIQVYNTLTRKKELFEPIEAPYVGMYVCGPTVYGDSHLGHAKSYVSFDLVVRYLRYSAYKVKYVQNITDVGHLVGDGEDGEDKLQKLAKAEQIDPMMIAEQYTKSYFDDMDALNVLRPDISPRATGHVPEQIEMIETLIEKNHAYEVNGSVYFDVRSFSDYGKLSGRTLEESESGTRININSEKRNPEDFALWKRAEKNHLMVWNSPWGKGFPGWHVECSAMSKKYLGNSFDIHAGGLENQFPHHECEIAQSECANEAQFVKYWLHNNMVTRDGVKMGKSLGNAITLREAIEAHDAMTVRMFVLNSHYRSTLDYSEHALESAQKGLARLQDAYKEMKFKIDYQSKENGKPLPIKTDKYKIDFFTVLDDDFSTPQAFAILFELVKEINSLSTKQFNKTELVELYEFLTIALDGIFGLIPKENQNSDLTPVLDGVMQMIFTSRDDARKNKDFAKSDEIRDALTALGIEVRDTPDGAKWVVK